MIRNVSQRKPPWGSEPRLHWNRIANRPSRHAVQDCNTIANAYVPVCSGFIVACADGRYGFQNHGADVLQWNRVVLWMKCVAPTSWVVGSSLQNNNRDISQSL